MKVANDVLAVLDECRTNGNLLYLPGQMDREMYVKVNKVLEAAGGKWQRYLKAHTFDGDAAGRMEQVILTGEISTAQEMGYFPTPRLVVDRLVALADLRPEHVVLEPSAGDGAIAAAVALLGCKVYAIEVDPKRVEFLTREMRSVVSVMSADFLTTQVQNLGRFDRVIANPPFAKQADITHVTHALGFLKPGGRLVSVMSNGVMFRTNAKTVAFRELVESRGGWFEALPDDAFRESGTGVRTVIVVIPA